ncbi:MAG: carboxymuconolactone decarboxylase family protein [Pseudobdellovibrionaceae bacterium]
MSISEKIDQYFEAQFPNHQTTIFRDLMMNLKKILEESPLDEVERFLGLLSIASALENKELIALAEEELRSRDLSQEQIQEAKESAAIMGMLNTYYKFKGYLSPESLESYQRAGLRMQSLAKPQNGKERFEMMAFAVSVVNGCPTCVSSHEKALRGHNVDPEKIHDLARMASVTKGLTALKKTL